MTDPLPWVTPDPMQAVAESTGARELHEQQEQDELDREYEHTPADERPPFPPTYFPDKGSLPAIPRRTAGSNLGNAPAPTPDDRNLPGVGAPVPTTPSWER